VLRDPTIDLDASDIEVYGKTKQGVGWNYAGVRSGRVHLASWVQDDLPDVGRAAGRGSVGDAAIPDRPRHPSPRPRPDADADPRPGVSPEPES